MQPIIDQIGGEDTVHALVERFYDLIEALPQGEQILRLHFRGHGMAHVRHEQFAFLCGFFGGRRHYEERHGHMNVREIHAHVPIRTVDAQNWLHCMDLALSETVAPDPVRNQIRAAFRRVAMVLVNTPDDPAS